jgi:N-carbamoyl-L-amino-acid hydrolase
VTSIAGTSGTTVTFTGRPGHAGTTPMEGRADAFAAAAGFALEARKLARSIPESVVTIGRLTIEPGAANVIPAQATLTVDARAPDMPRLAPLLDGLEAAARAAATNENCRAACARAWLYEPVEMSPEVIEPLRRAIAKLGYPWLELASGAGHDASVLAAAGIPTGMLFVRSGAGGMSHTPAEWTDPADLGLAVEALAATLQTLAA